MVKTKLKQVKEFFFFLAKCLYMIIEYITKIETISFEFSYCSRFFGIKGRRLCNDKNKFQVFFFLYKKPMWCLQAIEENKLKYKKKNIINVFRLKKNI